MQTNSSFIIEEIKRDNPNFNFDSPVQYQQFFGGSILKSSIFGKTSAVKIGSNKREYVFKKANPEVSEYEQILIKQVSKTNIINDQGVLPFAPNVSRALNSPDIHYLIYPYAPSIEKMYASNSIEEKVAVKLLCDVSKTISAATRVQTYHGNIKPSNIFNYQKRFVLSDWNGIEWLGLIVSKRKKMTSAEFDSYSTYAAPEIYSNILKDHKTMSLDLEKSDIYSLGLCVLRSYGLSEDKLISFKEKQRSIDKNKEQTIEIELRSIISDIIQSQEIADLIWNMLSPNPEKRPSAIDIVTIFEGDQDLGENSQDKMLSVISSFKKSLMESSIIDVPIKIKSNKNENTIENIKPHHTFFGPILCISMTHNGIHLACGSEDCSILIINLVTRIITHVIEKAHKSSVTSIQFSHSNKYILSSSSDCTVKVFSFEKQELIHSFCQNKTQQMRSAVWSPDDLFIAAGSEDFSLKIFSFKDRKTAPNYLSFFGVNQSWIRCVAWSPDGNYIATGSEDFTIKVINFKTQKLALSFDNIHSEGVTSIAWSPDSKFFASSSRDTNITIYSIAKQMVVHVFQRSHAHTITCLSWSSDHSRLVSCSEDGSIKIFCPIKKQWITSLYTAHEDAILACTWALNSTAVVTTGRDSVVKVFDPSTKKMLYSFDGGHSNWVKVVKYSPNGNHLLSASSDCRLNIYETLSKKCAWSFDGTNTKDSSNWEDISMRNNGIWSAAWSPDSKLIAFGTFEGSLKVIDFDSKSLYRNFQRLHAFMIRCVSWSSDNITCATCSDDGEVRIVNVLNNLIVSTITQLHSGVITCLIWSKFNKNYIITGGDDSCINIFDIEEKKSIFYLKKVHTDWIRSITTYKDYVASASTDRSVKIFKIGQKEHVQFYPGLHEQSINSIAWSTDGRFILTGGDDQTISIIDFEQKAILYKFKDIHTKPILSVTWSPYGKFFATGSADCSIKIFSVPARLGTVK